MYIIHLMIDGFEEEERMKTVVMMVKAFNICPDPRQQWQWRQKRKEILMGRFLAPQVL